MGDAHLHNADVLDKDVFDVNGHKLGHVTLARETPEGGLLSFDVVLKGRQQRRIGGGPVLTVGATHVVATDFDVTLDDDGVRLLPQDHVWPLEYEED